MPSPFDGARKVSRVPTLKCPTAAPLYHARHLPGASPHQPAAHQHPNVDQAGARARLHTHRSPTCKLKRSLRVRTTLGSGSSSSDSHSDSDSGSNSCTVTPPSQRYLTLTLNRDSVLAVSSSRDLRTRGGATSSSWDSASGRSCADLIIELPAKTSASVGSRRFAGAGELCALSVRPSSASVRVVRALPFTWKRIPPHPAPTQTQC